MTIENGVRVLAGSMVLLSVILTWHSHLVCPPQLSVVNSICGCKPDPKRIHRLLSCRILSQETRITLMTALPLSILKRCRVLATDLE